MALIFCSLLLTKVMNKGSWCFPVLSISGYLASCLFVSEVHMPRFAESIPNITVTIGKEAVLACVVDNLKNYKASSIFCLFFDEQK
jgi:hypothetical protein